MSVPEHLWRFPTRAAIDSLAKRFGFPNTATMQDWEWEVADPARIEQFLAVYQGGELCEDERFTLMETILQSFEDLPEPLEYDPRWIVALDLLDTNIQLHIYSVWYWSDVENENGEDSWRVTPQLRKLLDKHRTHFESTDNLAPSPEMSP
jgi:hypothetical protein